MLLAALLAATVSSPAELGPVPVATVRVFLVRHGQSLSNLDPPPNLPKAQLDNLTDLGRAQALRAGEALRGIEIASIVTSATARARQTAEEIRRALDKASLEVDPRLRPLELGVKPSGEPLDWDDRQAEWSAGRDPAPARGESLEQLGRRLLAAVMERRPRGAGRSVVFVGHGEVISNFVEMLKGTPPPKRFPSARVRNGSITVVEAGATPLPSLVLFDFLPQETPALAR
jgi:broad specificity phosphatase PhoE